MTKLPCPDELWPAFSALLDEALELPAEKRAAWLLTLGPRHREVLPWLSKVLTAEVHGDAGGFLYAPGKPDTESSDFQGGQTVGPYRLERRLGQGGMGEVWLANRHDGTLTRQVALKLPHRYLFADVLRRRFERERDILAALSHPHIAQLYDAGVDDLQHPYLAMEWVDGVSLTEHCTRGRLALGKRLDLFLQILDAVQYAHGRLIAHRDIKPSNILVTADNTVKLLDFGIGKLLDGPTSGGATGLTGAGMRLATPEYAAPEQLAGEPVTVAADIFSLGVVFYEVLSGGRPFPRRPVNTEHSPPRASAHIQPDFAVTLGGLSDGQLRRALSGDVDAILARALEPKPGRRYATAKAFAEDIENSRAHRPIVARRIGAPLLAARFVRRHWLGVTMSMGLLLTLVGGSLGIAWQAVRVQQEAQRTLTIKNFLIDVFRATDPRIAEGRPRGQITAHELLDISTGRIDSSFAAEPATEIELLGVTADIYRELDETTRSTQLYARESALARRHYGPNDAHTIDGMLGEAWNANVDADYPRALSLLAQVDPLIHAAHLDDSTVRARWYMVKGEALAPDAARREEAQQALSDAAAIFARSAGIDALYPGVLIDLGAMALEASHYASSADYYRRAIAVAGAHRELGSNLLLANAGLALALKNQGNFADAGVAFAAGTAIAERSYGRDSRSYWAIASDWARFRYERGERAAALQAFAALAAILPPAREGYRSASDALEGAQLLRKYGHCLATDGQGASAIALLQRAQTVASTSALHATDAVRLEFDLAKAYEAGGRDEAARHAYLEVLNRFEARQSGAPQLAMVHERWGRFLLRHDALDDAETEFTAVLRLSAERITEAAVLARAGLAAVAARRGHGDTAVTVSAAALQQLQQLTGFYDIRIEPYVWGVRADALRLAGDAAAAGTFAQRALAADRRYFAPESRERQDAESLARDLSVTVALIDPAEAR